MLTLLFPASLMLPVVFYTFIALTIGLTYIASVCHQNLVLKETGDLIKIKTFYYDLHNNTRFTQFILFSSLNIAYVWYAVYAAALLLCVYSGLYLFPAAVISMVITDQLYQQRWFPKFMETPYFLFSTALQIFAVFGFSNWFWMSLSVVNIGFFAWDYVQTHLRGAQSASSQFPIASKKQQLSFDDLLDVNHQRPKNKAELDLILNQVKDPLIRVTFNHFREASLVIDRLIGHAKEVDFNQFESLFNQMDFNDPELRSIIHNEMAMNDKFHAKEISDYQKAFKMNATSDNVDVQIAYLKQEMKHAVTKLVSPVYKNLDHQQVNTMVGQARLVLDFILKCPDESKRRHILLSVAIQAGSQCFRQFSETFAELFHAHVYKSAPLSLKDKAVLVAQSVREVKFKDYYYHVYHPLRRWNAITYNVDFLLTEDKNDYHAYENFAVQYGQFFYLQNQTLSQRVRGIYDIIGDYINTYVFWPFWSTVDMPFNAVHSKKYLFSDHYNAECLIESALAVSERYKNSEKNFHTIFEAWCNEIYPDAYHDVTLDSDFFPRSADDPCLRIMVKLMLLDLGLVELVPLKEDTLLSRLTDCKTWLSSRFPRISFFVGQMMTLLSHILSFVGSGFIRLIFTANQIDNLNWFAKVCFSWLVDKWFALPERTEAELAALQYTDELLKNIKSLKKKNGEPSSSTYHMIDALLDHGERPISSSESIAQSKKETSVGSSFGFFETTDIYPLEKADEDLGVLSALTL